MLLLKQNIIKKEQVERLPELDAGNDNSKEYKVKVIWDSTIYPSKSKLVYLLGFY